MKKKGMQRLGALAAAVCVALSSLPAFAAEGKTIEVSFEDITNDVKANTLPGEAKVRVHVKGADGKATIAQMAMNFDGALKYKSTRFLKGENAPERGGYWMAKAGADKSLLTGIISTGGMDFGEEEAIFEITFSGKVGENVTLNLTDLEDSYCTVDGADRYVAATQSILLTATDRENEAKTASIRLAMDKVSDFSGTESPELTVQIINENTGDVIQTAVSNTSFSEGGNRVSTTSTPTFLVEDTVAAEDSYTVEISGIGYITYRETGVKFNEKLELTNADFVPGDVNNDGKVDAEDKKMAEDFIAKKEYSISADFNRDGKVDSYDLLVFSGISEGTESGKDDKKDDKKDEGTGGNGGGTGGGGGGGNGGGSGGGSKGNSSGSGSSGLGGLGGMGGAAVSAKEPFTDLTNHAWAKDAIYTLKNRGIISGISETEFAPANQIKRGDFILILTKMLGVTDAFSENFADVPQDSYYYNAIGSAKAAGIASGDGDSFMPEQSITRQDLITLAYRAFLAKGYLSETEDLSALEAFSDHGDIAPYAQSAMAAMVQAGIISGSDGMLNPQGFATRAEVAVMCARMLALMK